jgi:glutaredoxin
MPTITMHSKNGCGYCDTSRAWLDANAIAHTETKYDDDAARAAMYDRLGLVGGARTVPQFVLTADGVDYLISGAKDLMQTGVESLFAKLPSSLFPGKVTVTLVKPSVSSSVVNADFVCPIAFEPTCESCE